MDAEPDYCPFCGARLAESMGSNDQDEDRLLVHLEDHEECNERYQAWNPGRMTVELAGNRRQSAFGRILMWALIGLALAYSLLVAQQPLIGLSVAIVVYILFNVEID